MNEITFQYSPLKGLKLIIFSALFMKGGIWLAGNNFDLLKWVVIILFGGCIFLGVFQMLDRRPKLILHMDGILNRAGRQNMIKWEQIKKVGVAKVYKSYVILLEMDDAFDIPGYKKQTTSGEYMGPIQLVIDLLQIKCNAHKLADFIEEMSKAEPGQRTVLIENYQKELKRKQ